VRSARGGQDILCGGVVIGGLWRVMVGEGAGGGGRDWCGETGGTGKVGWGEAKRAGLGWGLGRGGRWGAWRGGGAGGVGVGRGWMGGGRGILCISCWVLFLGCMYTRY
jgi:hypothetical protein